MSASTFLRSTGGEGEARGKLGEDKRGFGASEDNGTQGAGWSERVDWPMREVSPEGDDVGGEKRRVSAVAVEEDVGAVGGGVWSGEPGGGEWIVERDVSEVDERELEERGREEGGDMGIGLVSPLREREGEESHRVLGQDGGLSRELDRDAGSPDFKGSGWSSISPERDEVVRGGPVSELDVDDFQRASGVVERDDMQPQEDTNIETSQSTSTSHNGYESSRVHDVVTPPATQRQPDDIETDQIAQTSSQSPYHSPRPSVQTTPRSHIRQTSTLNGQTTPTTTHARQNSLMKSTPPGSSSRRSSIFNPYNTTQINHNNNRVRYSWQSAQDEQPNRPRIYIIKLVSNTATASAGFPQGEAFGFSMSPGGRRLAAYNSARLYVLQTAALPVGISQDYALKRRPLAVEIVDDGNVLAILADEHTVNIYDLSDNKLRRSRTIKPDFSTHCIALGPLGGLLAAAYEGGVEIFALDASALPTDRRAFRSQRMDKLSFSEDGSTLLGTTTRVNTSSTVVVNVPVFPSSPNNVPTSEELKVAWCSDLLSPENIRNSSHAVFMRENRTTCSERLFAWNGNVDTFGILNTTDMQYGHIDFPVVITPPLSTCGGLGAAIHSCPAVDEHGDTVAMIVNDRTIRLYIVPHKAKEGESTVEAHSIDHELDEGYGCPFSDLRWVYSNASLPAPLSNQTHVQGRLIVTSPGGVIESGLPEELVQDVEGGRIILFDFDPQFAGQPGQTFSLTLGKSPPQTLEEAEFDVADEVALVRSRTFKQSKNAGLSQRPITLGRSATTFNSHNALAAPTFARRTPSALSSHSDASRSLPDLLETSESAEIPFVEEPFSNTAPRSQASLQRAATNAQRHRYQTLEERNRECISVDSAGNFLALPEYTEEPNAPLPSRFRAMAGLDNPSQGPNPHHRRPSLLTNRNGAMSPESTPLTAPASLADNFSAEQAFAVANASYAAAQAPVPPERAPMPRSLQRAYSNAVRPRGPNSGAPPSLVGDWDNVTPMRSTTHRSSHNMERDATSTPPNYPPTGAYAHPITAWHPPSGSATLSPTTASFAHAQNQAPLHHTASHSRKSSLASKSAFASTSQAKKLGFFKRKKQTPPAAVGMWENRGEWDGDDGRSAVTWTTARTGRTGRTARGEGGGRGCAVM